MWSFFATWHGKGEVDEGNALLKHEVRKEQLKHIVDKLDNVLYIVNFLKREANKKYVTHPKVRRSINKHFWQVQINSVDRSHMLNYETFLGTKSLHQVWSVSHKDPTLFQIQDLSYFCVACVDTCLEEQCDSKSHVTPRSFRKLKPFNSLEVWKNTYDPNEEIGCRNGGELFANVVFVRDNIVLKANGSSIEDFWLMLVDKCVHVVEKNFISWLGQFLSTRKKCP